jgi:endonuclease-3
MARKTIKPRRKAAAAKPPAARRRGPATGKAAHVKARKVRVKADIKAAHGELPQWTTAEIEEAFRRFEAANPVPRGELQHINPFTLLVAVVLSAQATDAGVNKATPALFKLADTPEKMAKLGEAQVRDLIKTIGLYRTKAKNVIALSQKLVDEHGGKVPHDRQALEALPGVGRKTANVVLNIAFGEPTIAVDTHIFRVGNRTGLAVGKTPLEVEMKLMAVVPERYRLHAHHWLILHGRYVCAARRPLCEKCLIADLCKWPGKTVNAAAAGADVPQVASSLAFVQPSRRYRLFFDETGNGDLHAAKKDPNQRYLSLTGLVIRQDIHDSTITKRLTTLKRDIFGETNAGIIFHRRDIIDRKGVFAALENAALRAKFDKEFADLVRDIPSPVFTVSIDKQAHLEKYKVWQFSPYHYALTCLLERFVLWLNRTGNLGDVIGEARNPTHDAQLRRAFRYFYRNGTTVRRDVIQRCLTSGELRLQPKTANIAALQIADLLAHPAHRSYKFIKLGQDIPGDYGASLAAILQGSKYDRSRSGNIEGYGRKWLP